MVVLPSGNSASGVPIVCDFAKRKSVQYIQNLTFSADSPAVSTHNIGIPKRVMT